MELIIDNRQDKLEINEELINSPELINESAWDNWLVKVEADNFADDSASLLDYDDYKEEIQ